MSYKIKSVSLIVKDLRESRKFYEKVFNVKSVDIGCEAAICIEPETRLFLRSAQEFEKQTGLPAKTGYGAVIALFTENFEELLHRLEKLEINYVHPVKEQGNGQRVMRFYDVDGHVIEVVEDYAEACSRLIKGGASVEEIAKRLDLQPEALKSLIKNF